MKNKKMKWLAGGFLALMLGGASMTFAETDDTELREGLLAQIAELTKVIESLTAQMAALTGGDVREGIDRYHEYDEDAAIAHAIAWFREAQEDSGHFRYEYMPFTDRVVDDDHIVRQAGALYALGEVLVRDTEDIYNLAPLMELSADFFVGESVTGEYEGISFTCLLQGNDKCTLGGTSLALIGMLDLVSAHPELLPRYDATIKGYRNYITAMKMEDAGFINFYYRSHAQTRTESAFSNGEALLALVRYYQFAPSDSLKQFIDVTYKDLAKKPFDMSYYLWGMAAVKDLYALEPRDEYVDHVRDYTNWRIAPYVEKRGSIRNRCAYIEGVVSAYSVLEKDATLTERERLREEIDFWLAHSAKLQVAEGDTLSVAFGDEPASTLVLKDLSKAVGGFLTGANEPAQRIDFTQHCLNSFVQKKIDIDRMSFTQPRN